MQAILGKEWNRYKELMVERPYEFTNIDGVGSLSVLTDESRVLEYENTHNVTIGVVYESKYHLLLVDLVENENGDVFTYERLLKRVATGAVVIIPQFEGKFLLLKQFRHAIRDYQLSFPRGFGEDEISVEENASKELSEELGAVANNFVKLGNVIADSGICGNSVSVYKCNVISFENDIHDEGISSVVEVSEQEFQHLINMGKITDGFTLAAYAMLKS